ncbi:mucin-2 [Streptomyces yunnanensis]|uniref:Mucin-2 n=1 Tax=Streptomyces yunnanensis TaxID=156453 RepID=A0ABY8ACU2_9ACTN|nr:mucin-2 [Streptomyces yunnanensis]WEB41531.1 mucin-2 [Streptomyces yunnanensis]
MWAKLDDGFHSHPKIRKAGNAAVGLFARLLSYAGQHMTNGIVVGAVARDYGTGPQLRKLTAVGLLHEHGHVCGACAQPDPGDYVVHDFLDANPSRAQVRQARDKDARRKRNERNRDAPRPRNEDDSAPNRTRTAPHPGPEPHPDSGKEPQANGGRHTGRLAGVRVDPSHPDPCSLPEGREQSPQLPPRTAPAAGVPDFAHQLADRLAHAGVHVAWGTDSQDRQALRQLLDRVPVEHLVQHAVRTWNPNNPPRTIRYLIKVWAGLPAVPADAPLHPTAGGTTAPPVLSTGEQRAAQGLALAARLRAQETDTDLLLEALP